MDGHAFKGLFVMAVVGLVLSAAALVAGALLLLYLAARLAFWLL